MGGSVRLARLCHSKSEIAQSRVIIGTTAERPVVFALALLDRKIVDAGNTQAHQTVLVEFPVLVAIAAKPVAAVVVPLIGETDSNAVLAEGPDFLDQAVVELALPLAGQKLFDRFAALQEFRAVPPPAVARIGERDALRIARVPRILGHADLLDRGFQCEGWKWRGAAAPALPTQRCAREGACGCCAISQSPCVSKAGR